MIVNLWFEEDREKDLISVWIFDTDVCASPSMRKRDQLRTPYIIYLTYLFRDALSSITLQHYVFCGMSSVCKPHTMRWPLRLE